MGRYVYLKPVFFVAADFGPEFPKKPVVDILSTCRFFRDLDRGRDPNFSQRPPRGKHRSRFREPRPGRRHSRRYRGAFRVAVGTAPFSKYSPSDPTAPISRRFPSTMDHAANIPISSEWS